MDFLVSAQATRAAIFAAAVRTGRPAEELARLVKVSPTVLGDPDARISHDRTRAVWSTLARESGDPALGLFAAQLIDSAAGDRLQPLLAHAPTLGDAMQTFVRYQQLYHQGNASRSEIGADWRITFALHREATPSPELVDFVLCTWLRRLRHAAGRTIAAKVLLRRAKPSHVAPYRDAFGAVELGAKVDALVLPVAAAAYPIAGANETLRANLERQARIALLTADGDPAFLVDARAALQVALVEGPVDVEVLARSLATSPRTLQRRLAACETTFQELLDEVRREVAVAHLARGRSVTDTAFLVGFSELSAFSRAFRRWTGQPPRAYRC